MSLFGFQYKVEIGPDVVAEVKKLVAVFNPALAESIQESPIRANVNLSFKDMLVLRRTSKDLAKVLQGLQPVVAALVAAGKEVKTQLPALAAIGTQLAGAINVTVEGESSGTTFYEEGTLLGTHKKAL